MMGSKVAAAVLPVALGLGGPAGCKRLGSPTPVSHEAPAVLAEGRRSAEPVPGEPAEPVAASRLLSAINESRRRAHLRPLRLDEALMNAAAARAADMSHTGYFGHVSPSGRTPFDVMTAYGYDYARAGENLARGLTDPGQIENAWMGSRPHRLNVLNPDYRDVGIAIDGDLVVALFGVRLPPAGRATTRGRE